MSKARQEALITHELFLDRPIAAVDGCLEHIQVVAGPTQDANNASQVNSPTHFIATSASTPRAVRLSPATTPSLACHCLAVQAVTASACDMQPQKHPSRSCHASQCTLVHHSFQLSAVGLHPLAWLLKQHSSPAPERHQHQHLTAVTTALQVFPLLLIRSCAHPRTLAPSGPACWCMCRWQPGGPQSLCITSMNTPHCVGGKHW